MQKVVTLKIKSLGCVQCRQAVESAIRRLSEVEDLRMVYDGATDILEIAVTYRSGRKLFERIHNAILELGYPIRGYMIHGHEHAHGDVSHHHEHGH